MFASGYGGRNRPTDSKIHDLYARAAALRDERDKTVVFVSMDLIGVPIKMVRLVSAAVKEKHGLQRAELMFAASHTHCGPALDDNLSHMLAMTDADWAQVRKYQKQLNGKIIALIDRAIEDLKPARLDSGNGSCGFAANRRSPKGLGPYDHDVPVLRITSPDGTKLRGVIFGYACHNTTMGFYKWFGDYAGLAQLHLEDRHPGAVAMFFSGCGADQNPLPRRKLELAQKYGRSLGVAVETVMSKEMKPVRSSVRSGFKNIDLEFQSIPTKDQLQADLKSSSRYRRQRAAFLLEKIEKNGSLSKTYPYPIQVWELGMGVTWVALGGEVVVDYSLRLKRELDSPQTWVTGFANDVMAYIPSERVLKEGGYEGDSSMIYYQQPSKWKAGLEDQIVGTIVEIRKTLQSQSQ